MKYNLRALLFFCGVILITGIPLTLAATKHISLSQTKQMHTHPLPSPTLVAPFTPTPTVEQKALPVAASKPTPTSAPLPTNTPVPTIAVVVSNPPVITISYPSENQSITFTSASQTFCVVDTPAGGNTSGLMRRQNINNQGWSSYTTENTLCFQPNNGSNTFQLQYKNAQGDESGIYTRDFSFSLQQNITVSLHGELYNDLNCNSNIDQGESGIPNVSMTIMQSNGLVLGNVTTDSNGNYSFSKDISPIATLSLQPAPNDHAYTFPVPSPVTLSASNTSATLNLNHCP